MDTICGGNLTNAPLLQNLHPKVFECTLTQIIAPHAKKRTTGNISMLYLQQKAEDTHVFCVQ